MWFRGPQALKNICGSGANAPGIERSKQGNGVISVMTLSVTVCPHCKAQTSIPGGFDEIRGGWVTCEHCQSEFLIIDNTPMTEGQ